MNSITMNQTENISFTPEEKKVIATLDTPRKIHEYLQTQIKYEKQDDMPQEQQTNRSFRRVLRDKKAHCLEAVFFSAAVMKAHGYLPLFVNLDIFSIDMPHNIYVFKDKYTGRYGSLAISRDPMLWGRMPAYNTFDDLIDSYYYVYTEYMDIFAAGNPKDARMTLRGHSAIINLRDYEKKGIDWILGEENLDMIEDDLFKTVYRRLHSKNGLSKFYKSPNGLNAIKINDKEASKYRFNI